MVPDGYEVFRHPEDYDLSEGFNDEDFSDARFDPGWYWWSCQPGCIPDGDPSGPFETRAEALADLTEGIVP